jgi:hypothetical protein
MLVATSAACGESDRSRPGPNGAGGTSAGTAGGGGEDGGRGGAAGTGNAGVAGTPARGGASNSGGSSGRGGSSGGSGKSGITDVLDFNAARWAAFCRGLFQCNIEAEDAPGLRAVFGTEERCQELLASSMPMNFGLPDLIAAVDDGRVAFAADRVDACLEATARCDHLVNSQPADVACRRVFLGTKAAGEACSRDEECADDRRCVISDACPGSCAARIAPGGACEADADCDDTNSPVDCDYETSTCTTTLVLPPVGEGEECWFSSPGKVDRQPCADGLWCDGDGTFASEEYRNGTCRRTLIPVGDPCGSDEDLCEDGAACWDDVCTVLTIGREPGAPCSETSFCDPFARLQCVEGACESIGDGREGSPCRFHDLSAHAACEPGFVCVVTGSDDPVTSATARTCLPPLATGASCKGSHECLSRTCGADGLCAASFCGNSKARY